MDGTEAKNGSDTFEGGGWVLGDKQMRPEAPAIPLDKLKEGGFGVKGTADRCFNFE